MNFSIRQLCVVFLFLIGITVQAQETIHLTFKDTRVINTHSTEMLRSGQMDIRIGHRFGDFAGAQGGWKNFYGLENASDILTGVELGLSDNLMLGINRTKGAGPLKQNVQGFSKIRLITQEVEGSQPFNLALLAAMTYSTMEKSRNEGTINFFENRAHRMSYHLSFIISRKFSPYFSAQFNGAWTYRNIVFAGDKNDLVSVGFAAKYQWTKSIGLIVDGTLPISEYRTAENGYYPILGVGFEWDTGGGHVFQLNLTNSTGIIETDYIPNTTSNWAEGQFRLGFTISRRFKV